MVAYMDLDEKEAVPPSNGHKNGAEDEIRTRDLLLGKEMLYH